MTLAQSGGQTTKHVLLYWPSAHQVVSAAKWGPVCLITAGTLPPPVSGPFLVGLASHERPIIAAHGSGAWPGHVLNSERIYTVRGCCGLLVLIAAPFTACNPVRNRSTIAMGVWPKQTPA